MPEPGLSCKPLLESLRSDQLARWQRGERALVESYLQREPALQTDSDAVLDLIYSEIVVREERGESPVLDEYLRRFPQFGDTLRRQFAVHRALETPVARDELETVFPSSEPNAVSAAEGEAPPAAPGFELLELLGRGGMGVVWKARQLRPGRLVALKMLHPGAAGVQEGRRLLREAEAAAQLQHPNIVSVLEVGEAAGRPFVVLELVDGGSLAQRLNGTPLPARPAAELLEVLARAMAYAHERGIIHRDLKPANVLLTAEGVARITDFGLVKLLDAATLQSHSGVIQGTPSYMPPEQAECRSTDIGPHSDVYALGAILYEMLTGRPPFKAETLLETVMQVVHAEAAPPRSLNPSVPRDLETICLKCLEKSPRQRYGSARVLADDVGRFLRGEPIHARPARAWERVVKWSRRRPAAAALVAVSCAALLALLGGWAWFTGQLQTAKVHAEEQQRLADEQRREAQRERERALEQELLAKEQERIAREQAALAREQGRLALEQRDLARQQQERAEKILEIAMGAVNEFSQVIKEGKRMAEARSNPGFLLFKLACAFSRAATIIQSAGDLPEQDRAKLSARYADRAVDLLTTAAQLGFFTDFANREKFKEAKELDPLRPRLQFLK
jgi:serine/threonine-protein kinase